MKITINLTALLTVVFITLKILNLITWPWLWVLSPLWIPPAIALTVTITLAILGLFFLIILILLGVLLEKPLDK